MTTPFDDHYKLALELAGIFSDRYNRQINRGSDETKKGFVNELQKAFSYLRWSKDIKKMLDLSHKRSNSQGFSQTKNTSDYYKVIYEAIRTFQKRHSDLDYGSMLYVIGWAVRITSYEFKVGADNKSRGVSHSNLFSSAPSRPQPAPAQSSPSQTQPAARPASTPSPSPPTAQTAPPAPPANVPQRGEVFTGAVLKVGDDAVLVLVKNFDQDQVVGIMRSETIPDGNTARYSVGNLARVEVIAVQQKGDRIILELKPAPKKQTRS